MSLEKANSDYENNFDLADLLEQSQGPSGVLGLTVRATVLMPHLSACLGWQLV